VSLAQADKEMRQDIMQLLYKQNMVIQQEHFIHVDIEPSADFLEDMEIIHGSNKTEVEEDAEPEFPPEGTKENFFFDSKQMQGLELDSPGAHLLTDSSLNPRNPVANSSVSYLKGENRDICLCFLGISALLRLPTCLFSIHTISLNHRQWRLGFGIARACYSDGAC
jgi:hypothetical protein